MVNVEAIDPAHSAGPEADPETLPRVGHTHGPPRKLSPLYR